MKRSPMPRRREWMKRGATGLRRTRWMKARNAQRKAKNDARAYGSDERVAFVKTLPCLVCGHMPSENAHLGNGGMSRKSEADQIVPLCGRFANGHHYELDDQLGSAALFEAKYAAELRHQTLAWHAQHTDRLWRAFGGEA